MFWPTEAQRLRIGPEGLWIGGREVAGGPLTVADLPQALARLSLPPGSRIAVSVADVWAKTMLLDIPSGIRRREEIAALARHRFQETFSAFNAAWVIAFGRRHAPWPGLLRRVSPAAMPAAAMDSRVPRACMDWARAAGVRVAAIGTDWGWALASVPASAQGALASFCDGRVTVGAWSASRWLGWRSFLVTSASAGADELKGWLAGLPWASGSVTVWCAGWRQQEVLDERWDWRCLAEGAKSLRGVCLDFRGAMSAPRMPLRQKVIVAAGLATLVGAVVVSLPENGAEPDAEAVVSAYQRPQPQPVVAAPAPDIRSEPEVQVIEDEVEWPEVQGTFAQPGGRWLLYVEDEQIRSVRQGGAIGGRFRVEQATPWFVVLRDMKTGERRKISLEFSGDEP